MAMGPDDHVCYCFHVSLRKIENFCKSQKPQHASQISECLSAGTGCGWCVPLLRKIHKRICGAHTPWWRRSHDQTPETTSALEYASAEDYAAARAAYIQQKRDRGQPAAQGAAENQGPSMQRDPGRDSVKRTD